MGKSMQENLEQLTEQLNEVAKVEPQKSGNTFKFVEEKIEELYPGIFRNDITDRLMYDVTKPFDVDRDVDRIYHQCKGKKGVTTGMIRSLVNAFPPSRNPILEYLSDSRISTEKRAIKEIKKWTAFLKFSNGNLAEFYETVFIKWFVGAVASIYPGKRNTILPILIGNNNVGKTYMVDNLLPSELQQYYMRDHFKAKPDKDEQLKACENLLIFYDELHGINSVESGALRDSLERTRYSLRASYRRDTKTYERLASYIGAGNNRDVIKDPEFNRRIIPVLLDNNAMAKVRLKGGAYDKLNFGMIWKAAFYLYSQGYDYELSRGEIERVLLLSKEFEIADIYSDIIEVYLQPDRENTMTCTEIIVELKSKFHGMPNLSTTWLGRKLSAHGFKRNRRKYFVDFQTWVKVGLDKPSDDYNGVLPF